MVTRLPNHKPEPVEASDEFTTSYQEGRAHALSYYKSGRNTLVDQISQEDWENWDGLDELALVSDPDGLELPDKVEVAA
jgi:hypothetical protein